MGRSTISYAAEWAASAWEHLDLRAPVDLDLVRRWLHLRLRARPLPEDQSGGIGRTAKTVYILVNSTHSPQRRRFTIAHEIGEYLLMRHHERTGRRLAQGELKETFCDRFAASLLMPEQLVTEIAEELRHNRSNNDKTAVMAQRFGVSSQAMAYRLWELGINTTTRQRRGSADIADFHARAKAYARQLLAELA